MTSINQNQPEKNHQDVSGADAVAKIRELVAQSPNCFFCSKTSAPAPAGARPMNVRQVDDDGILWFLSANDSHANQELALDSSVTLYFHGSKHSDFLALAGDAEVSTDLAKIKELWEPILKTWFTGSIDDPRITVIKFSPIAGYYWDTKHGNMVAGVKMMIGASLGITLDESIEGKINV